MAYIETTTGPGRPVVRALANEADGTHLVEVTIDRSAVTFTYEEAVEVAWSMLAVTQ